LDAFPDGYRFVEVRICRRGGQRRHLASRPGRKTDDLIAERG